MAFSSSAVNAIERAIRGVYICTYNTIPEVGIIGIAVEADSRQKKIDSVRAMPAWITKMPDAVPEFSAARPLAIISAMCNNPFWPRDRLKAHDWDAIFDTNNNSLWCRDDLNDGLVCIGSGSSSFVTALLVTSLNKTSSPKLRSDVLNMSLFCDR